MAYAPRPDGMNDLFLDDGTRVLSPLPAEQLESMGHQMVGGMPVPQAPGLDPMAVAGPGGGVPELPPEGWAPGSFGMPSQSQQVPGHGGMAPASAYNEPPAAAGPAPAAAEQQARLQGENAVAQAEEAKRRASSAYGASQQPAAAPGAKARNLVPLGGGMGGQQQMGSGYAPQRVTKIKGGDVRASFVRQPGQEVPDDVKADALNTDAEDLELTADNIVAQREELRQKREVQLLEQQKMIDQQAVRRQQVDQRIAAKSNVIDQRDREIEKMRPQSASEVWEEKGTVARVLASLTAGLVGGLNGYAAGLQGRAAGPNQVLVSINEAVMDEVAHQRANYEAALARGDVARNDYARAIAIYGTPEAAALDIEMRGIGLSEKLLENRASKIQDQEYLQASNQAASALRAQRADVKMKLLELEKGKTVQENWQYQPDRFMVSGGAPKVKNPETIVRLPSGQYMFARGGTEARAAQGKIVANARLAELSGRLKSLTDTVGKREPTAPEKAAAETIKSEMMFTYKDASQAGALDKGLQDAMEGYFGKAADVFRVEDVGRKLDEVGRIATKKVNEVVTYDLHPDQSYSPSVPVRPPGESDE